MRHVTALLLKYILVTAILYVIQMLLFRENVWNIIVLGFVVTIVSYIVGDLGILPMSGNITASIADFALSYLTIWLTERYVFANYATPASVFLVSSLILAAGEWYFHGYMQRNILTEA
ncbi:DUF2512 family protein [Aneurinibacillus sp. Ricciae_BoGa-3]|uniref:DUF2512 family protein n=1 Tax=Aneurinibacillus sp. Ricciae_BoGa-3 TaxID=3022697 RepID=UPI0023402B83|nr:DUF2512 family protein [Aneurinibacillus sp. Ricciae_BoGa-3]WCK56194.1 DUF2512 family protein [Aneurinibacillus sp. Ricciae_BoGa-3]